MSETKRREEFLSVPQVAGAFGVKARTVRGWIHRKLIAAKKDRATGMLYVPVSEVERRKANLEDWQPGLKPVTFKGAQPEGEASTSVNEKESENMAKGKTQEQQAQEQTQTQAAGQRARGEKKRASWGTVLDDEDDEDEEEE